MTGDTPHRHSSAKRDLAIAVIGVLGMFALASALDFHETWLHFVAQNEEWVLDGIPVALGFVGTGFGWFVFRRWREDAFEARRRIAINERLKGEIAVREKAEAALHERDARVRGIMDNVAEGIVTTDETGSIESFNPAAEKIFGYAASEVLDHNVSVLMPASERAGHDGYIGAYLGGGPAKILGVGPREMTGQRKNGSTFPMDLAVSEMWSGGRRAFIAVLRDITVRRQRLEAIRGMTKQVELLRKIATAANEATTVQEALQVCLDAVCEHTQWPVGHAYMFDAEDTGELISTRLWHLDNPERFETFRAVTERSHFASGVGLPGCVLASGQPAWFTDVHTNLEFSRAKQAYSIGVTTAFAFPVKVGQSVVAVLEFFSAERVEPIDNFLDVMEQIGTQLGRVVERKQATQALRESEQRYRGIFVDSPVALWEEDWSPIKQMIDDLARQGVMDWRAYFLDRRDEVIRAYDLARPIDISRAVLDIYRAPDKATLLDITRGDVATQEDIEGFREVLISFIEGQTSCDVEARDVRCDGMDVIVRCRFTVLPEHRQDWSRVLYAIEDVTERKQAEESLKQNERELAKKSRLLEATLESIDQGLVVFDEDLRAVLWNERARTLYEFPVGIPNAQTTLADLLRYNVERGVYSADDVERFVRDETEHARRFEHLQIECTLPDGTVLDRRRNPMPGGGFVTTYTDITERKQAEEKVRAAMEEAEAASRAKSEFLAAVSHELHTPLNAIIGFSEILKEQLFGPLGSEQYLSYTSDIHASGSHLLAVINDILDIARIESGKTKLDEDEFDTRKVIDSALRLVTPRAVSGGISLKVEIKKAPVRFRGDARKLKQILVNLLSNAIKFTPAPGTARLSAACSRKGEFVVTIRDTGIGMAAEDIPKALEPFGQVDSALSRSYEGTGLGLSLTKAMVEMHGGTLSIDSEPGVGTSVTVVFPPERTIIGTIAAA